MRIIFRTDASLQIGTGHVMRCLALADELARQGHECRFVSREHSGHLSDLILSKGYALTLLPVPVKYDYDVVADSSERYASWLGVPWQEDAKQTLDAIEALNADWLVIDHYALDAEWEKTLAHAVGNIMVIDDLANRAHACALLLDQNLGRAHEDYEALLPGTCESLIGPRFALLRLEFSSLRQQSLARRTTSELKRILLTLGGVDRDNVTGQILTALASSQLPASTKIDVVMGKTAPHLKVVQAQVAHLPFNVTVSVNVTDMAGRMCKADLAIGAAGSTSWERCCLGLPSLTVVVAENQQKIAEALSNAGATKVVDPRPDLDSCLPDMELLRTMSQNAAKICDGLGAKRVCERIGSFNA
ncbi:UDP-2,4-diacetamido-2,4,6-trideoxy-beta-L-altropyranose hydrolase [Pseudohongiella nitratireducens]|uniref:UDP-2,4-diacetamido-2,4, 6-trideoxy-beta-L-altropyranose hydrolase n=1 Tax=Pseudohongiella nitratireducens TaxID=1768907 RepID=UPI0030EE57B4